MISVIVPVYNKEDYIDFCLQSILQQEFIDFEVIVVNDGSTDNSLGRIDDFVDPRIRVFTIINGGVAKARNFGIRKANYDWVAFLDADDWWDKNFLACIAAAMIEFPNINVFATGRARVFNNTHRVFKPSYINHSLINQRIHFNDTLSVKGSVINSSNCVIKKTAIVDCGLFPVGRRIEDLDTWIRLCANRNIVIVNKTLSYYRKLVLNSATKRGGVSVSDFLEHFNTIIGIISITESEEDKKKLSLYLYRFITVKFVLTKIFYTDKEKSNFINGTFEITNNTRLKYLLILLKRIPIVDCYKFLKRVFS